MHSLLQQSLLESEIITRFYNFKLRIFKMFNYFVELRIIFLEQITSATNYSSLETKRKTRGKISFQTALFHCLVWTDFVQHTFRFPLQESFPSLDSSLNSSQFSSYFSFHGALGRSTWSNIVAFIFNSFNLSRFLFLSHSSL